MVVITDLTTVFWTIVFGNLVMVGLMLLVISSTANQILDETSGASPFVRLSSFSRLFLA